MATTLRFHAAASDYGTGNNDPKLDGSTSAWIASRIDTSAGAGISSAATNTVAGATNGVEVIYLTGQTIPRVWYSPPLAADITIAGAITWNLWASEADMAANVAINGQIEVIDGATGAITLIDKTARTTEVAVATRAVNNFSETPAAGVACKKGDRLRVRVFGDDVGTMAAGSNFTLAFDGATPTADGDSYLTLTEDLTFVSEPAGTTVYPTDTASDVSATAASLLDDFTGADQNPIAGNWSKLNSSDTGAIQRVGNAAGTTSIALGQVYWNAASFGPDVEAAITITTVSSGQPRIFARVQGEGGAFTWDGYQFSFSGSDFVLHRIANGSNAATLGSSAETLANGGKLGIACHGDVIEGWHQPSGGSWRKLIRAVDSTYPDAGKAGFGGTANAGLRMDDFYAGTTIGGAFGGLVEREAWTSRGAGVQSDVTNTVAGWTVPIQITDTAGGTVVDWFTKPLTAFTLGGAVRCNLHGLESVDTINSAFRVEVALVAGDGTSPTVWAVGTYPFSVLATTAVRSFLISGDDLAISDGQRLRIRVYADDAGNGPMASGGTQTLQYGASSGGATGDTYLTFSQTLTEFVAGTNAAAELASGAGAANNAGKTVAPNAGSAAGTGSAFNATVSTASAEEAPADPALGTGVAANASASVKPNAGAASGTGAALTASASVKPNASVGSGTGAAGNVAGSVAGSSGAATGTGTSGSPAGSIAVNVGHAAGSGSAFNATVSTEAGGGPVWTTPGDGVEISSTPTLAFVIPVAALPLFFDMQIDSADTFDTVDFQEFRSDQDQTGWDFWNGSGWEAVAPTGVPETYAGNEARYTVQTPLDPGTHYRRVRAGTEA